MTSIRDYSIAGLKLSVAQLQVGDCIKQLDGPFGTAIVAQATDKEVKLFRPYGTTAGFTYSDNRTICYTGTEETIFLRDSKQEFEVYYREREA
jgi:hypothetical protein